MFTKWGTPGLVVKASASLMEGLVSTLSGPPYPHFLLEQTLGGNAPGDRSSFLLVSLPTISHSMLKHQGSQPVAHQPL